MVIVALHAETGINLLHMVFVDLIAVDFSIRIIKQGVSIVQPVRCLDDSRKLMQHGFFSGLHIHRAENAVGVVSVPCPSREHFSGAAGILQCCRIHIHNLQCTVCAGELEAGFQINHAFSKRRFLAGDFHIFIMNGFDSVRMRPEELFRVDAAAVHPADIYFCSDFFTAGFQEIFVRCFSIHADTDIFFFVVDQKTCSGFFQFFCQFAVSCSGFVQNIFCLACRALYDKPGNVVFLRQFCKNGKFSFIVVFIQENVDRMNLNVVFCKQRHCLLQILRDPETVVPGINTESETRLDLAVACLIDFL